MLQVESPVRENGKETGQSDWDERIRSVERKPEQKAFVKIFLKVNFIKYPQPYSGWIEGPGGASGLHLEGWICVDGGDELYWWELLIFSLFIAYGSQPLAVKSIMEPDRAQIHMFTLTPIFLPLLYGSQGIDGGNKWILSQRQFVFCIIDILLVWVILKLQVAAHGP